MDEDSPPIPRAPKGLGTSGRALWRQIHATFDFTDEPGRLAVLEQACRTRDELDRLEQAMEGQPLVVLGSARQVQIHPVQAEIRFTRKALAELIGKLGLPDNDDDEDTTKARRHRAAKAGARARWNRGGS